MKFQIPYGRNRYTLDVPDKNFLNDLHANYGIPQSKDEVISSGLSNAIGTSLKEMVPTASGKTLVLVNDHTRQEDRIGVLDQLSQYLNHFEIMIATGTHRATTPVELQEMLGPYYKGSKIHIHNCQNSHTYLGETSRGTPVYSDPRLPEYDLVIPLGVIEPHYFAGYAGPLGCCKSISVGTAGYSTVEHNHSMAILPETYCGRFQNNPLAQDLNEISSIIEEKVNLFCIGNLLKGWDIIKVFAGDRMKAFPVAKKAMDSASKVSPEPADILVVSQGGYPRDLDLYQSQKSLEHTKYAVKLGGKIIWLAECGTGLGHGLNRIIDILDQFPEDVMHQIRDQYRLGMHKIYRLVELTQRAEIFLYSSLEDPLPNALQVTKIKDPQKKLDTLLHDNPDATVNIASEGCEIFTECRD